MRTNADFRSYKPRKEMHHDKTLVDYVADVLIDHLSGVTIGRVDREKGTIRVVSGSSGLAHEISFKKVK